MNSWLTEFGNAFQQRRILVTGATGFIGRHLCHALVGLGADVVGLSRTASEHNLPKGVRALPADLRQYNDVQKAVSQADADLIFHMGGLVTARRDLSLVVPMFEENAGGTLHLLLAALQNKCQRFVLVSSLETGHDLPTARSSPYAASKLVAELYGQMFHRLYELPVTCLRLCMTYGPGQESTKLIPYTILCLLRGESPQLASGERVCDMIFVDDVVRGLLMAALAGPNIVGAQLDLGTGKGTTTKEAVERIAALIGTSLRPTFGAIPDRLHEKSSIADLSRTRSLLGWSPTWTLDAGLRETVRWYQKQGQAGGAA